MELEERAGEEVLLKIGCGVGTRPLPTGRFNCLVWCKYDLLNFRPAVRPRLTPGPERAIKLRNYD